MLRSRRTELLPGQPAELGKPLFSDDLVRVWEVAPHQESVLDELAAEAQKHGLGY